MVMVMMIIVMINRMMIMVMVMMMIIVVVVSWDVRGWWWGSYCINSGWSIDINWRMVSRCRSNRCMMMPMVLINMDIGWISRCSSRFIGGYFCPKTMIICNVIYFTVNTMSISKSIRSFLVAVWITCQKKKNEIKKNFFSCLKQLKLRCEKERHNLNLKYGLWIIMINLTWHVCAIRLVIKKCRELLFNPKCSINYIPNYE